MLAGGCASGGAPVDAGDCANWSDLSDSEAGGTSIETVECSEPHDAQFYATFELDFDSFPGQDAIDAQAETQCIEEFEEFVGSEYLDSELRVDYFRPDEGSWAASGGHWVSCVAYLAQGTTTESFEGSGR